MTMDINEGAGMTVCPKCHQMALETDKTCYGCEYELRDVPLSAREWWELLGSPIFWILADLGLIYGFVRFVRWAWYN